MNDYTPPCPTVYCVYRIVCFSTGKVYVGITTDATKRRREHFASLASNRHFNNYLQRAYNKWGAGSFYYEVIERGVSSGDIDKRERYWISHFNSFRDGYNANPGGDITNNGGKSCTWNGVAYPTITAAALANGVTKTTMHTRLKRGYACDNDVAKWGCVWNGVQYPSISEAARVNGLERKSLEKHIQKGRTCNADIPPYRRACVWNGINYISVKEAAKANNISATTLKNWLNKGYVANSDVPDFYRKVIYNGTEYSSLTEAAAVNKISVGLMFHRLKKT